MWHEVAYKAAWSRYLEKHNIPIDIDLLSTSRELDMRFRRARLVRMAPLGPSAVDQIRLQRVRGLDRVVRGRQ